ncbi:hypothetical protein GGI42DRAFT_225643 [Trichoderma sp. SZMC 28013]
MSGLCLCSDNKRHGSRIRIRIGIRLRIRGPAGSRQRVLYAPQLSRCINPPKRQWNLSSISSILVARGQATQAAASAPPASCAGRVRAAAFAPFPPFLICPRP